MPVPFSHPAIKPSLTATAFTFIQSELSFPQKQNHTCKYDLPVFPLRSALLHTVFLQSVRARHVPYPTASDRHLHHAP